MLNANLATNQPELGKPKPLDDGMHRVVGRRVPDAEAWGGVSTYNVLQKRVPVLFGLLERWVDIDMEVVPPHVEICVGCTGDTGGWRNKFADLITH